MAFDNRVTTLTESKLMPKVVDTILDSNVLTGRTLRNSKRFTGTQMQFPVKFEATTDGGFFSGAEVHTTTATSNRIKISFDPKFYEKSVTILKTEATVNQTAGKQKVLDLIKTELKSKAQDAADAIGTALYSSNATDSKQFLGLQDIVDDGGTVATYGGQSRATYPTIGGVDTASGGTLSLDKLATLYNNITSGAVQPTDIYTTPSVFSYYEKLLQPQERIYKTPSLYAGGLAASSGYTTLDYKGIPVLADEKCTSGYLYMLNEKFLNFYSMQMIDTSTIATADTDIVGNDYSKNSGFGFTYIPGWLTPTNQSAWVTHIYLCGEFISENPKRQGVLTGITGV